MQIKKVKHPKIVADTIKATFAYLSNKRGAKKNVEPKNKDTTDIFVELFKRDGCADIATFDARQYDKLPLSFLASILLLFYFFTHTPRPLSISMRKYQIMSD